MMETNISDDRVSGSEADTPVMHKELEPLMTAIKSEFDQLREEMATKDDLTGLATKEELAEVKRLQGRTLEIVESIDMQFKQFKNIPQRLEKVERDVEELKMKVEG